MPINYVRLSLGLLNNQVGLPLHCSSTIALLFVYFQVYVNMSRKGLYDEKLPEILQKVKDKTTNEIASTKSYPPCFVSYCWQNSSDAVQKGTRYVNSYYGICNFLPSWIKFSGSMLLFFQDVDMVVTDTVRAVRSLYFFNPFGAGTLFRHQNLKTVLALKELKHF